ncbi:MAG: flagellar biosynthesis regulator FlaF [Rhodospirillales bacterium]|nr:flagellar biosynthesis regulator FlaF [Rhodospirillales bacterium]
MSVKRYQHVQEISDDPRAIEQRALARVTGMLIAGAEKGGAALAEACHMNRMLWTIFQTDLATPENALPDALKAQLISLAIWVQRYTSKVLFENASIEPLVQVNRSIMEGLAPSAPATAPAASPPAAAAIRA